MVKKSKVNIYGIIRITAGKNHCWVLSDVGIIRKPINVVRNNFTMNSHFVSEQGETTPNKLVTKIIIIIKHLINIILKMLQKHT